MSIWAKAHDFDDGADSFERRESGAAEQNSPNLAKAEGS
jgi:hypothetical protein